MILSLDCLIFFLIDSKLYSSITTDLENNKMVAARRKAFMDASPLMRKSFSGISATCRAPLSTLFFF